MQFVHRSTSIAVNRDWLHLHVFRKEEASSGTGPTFPSQVPQTSRYEHKKCLGTKYGLGFGQFYRLEACKQKRFYVTQWCQQYHHSISIPTHNLPADTNTATPVTETGSVFQAGLHWLAGAIHHFHYLWTNYDFLPQMVSVFW